MEHFSKDVEKMGVMYTFIGGVLSHGSMYTQYPMLSDMREYALRDGLIATFMHGRAIKIPLLPFMIAMFGLSFVILQDIPVDKLIKNKYF